MSIRIVIADDHPVVLHGLAALLMAERDFEIVGRARDGAEALRAVRRFAPDILVLDLRMPGEDGFAVLRELRDEGIATRVVVLTAIDGDDLVEAVRLGVRGVVRKDVAARQLVRCLREVHAGGQWLERDVSARLVDDLLGHRSHGRAAKAALTPREVQVARLVAEGLHNKAVARKLAISEGTARLHLHHVYQKLHLTGRAALSRYARTHPIK